MTEKIGHVLRRRYADKGKNEGSRTKQEKLATQYGCYFSILFERERFDAIRFTVIDPMHNLFLGTAKRMFQIRIEKDLLTKVIEEIINKLDVGTGVGRLPHKIASNHGRYEALQ